MDLSELGSAGVVVFWGAMGAIIILAIVGFRKQCKLLKYMFATINKYPDKISCIIRGYPVVAELEWFENRRVYVINVASVDHLFLPESEKKDGEASEGGSWRRVFKSLSSLTGPGGYLKKAEENYNQPTEVARRESTQALLQPSVPGQTEEFEIPEGLRGTSEEESFKRFCELTKPGGLMEQVIKSAYNTPEEIERQKLRERIRQIIDK